MTNRRDTIDALSRAVAEGRIRFPTSPVMTGELRNHTTDAFAYAFRTPERQTELERANRDVPRVRCEIRAETPLSDAIARAQRGISLGFEVERRRLERAERVGYDLGDEERTVGALGRNPLDEFAPSHEADAVLERELSRRARAASAELEERFFPERRTRISDPRTGHLPERRGFEPRGRTVRVAVHIGCPNETRPGFGSIVIPTPLRGREIRRCSGCSHVWDEVELMQSGSLEAVNLALVNVPEIAWIAAMGEAERRSSSSRSYGSEPEIPKEAEALEPPSSRLPMYRPR